MLSKLFKMFKKDKAEKPKVKPEKFDAKAHRDKIKAMENKE